MSQATMLVAPTTARDLLIGSDGAPNDDGGRYRLDLALDNAGVGRVRMTAISRLTPDATQAVQRQVRSVLSELLGQWPFGHLLVAGWASMSGLMEVARRSVQQPDGVLVAQLAEHTVTVTHEPSIQVVVDGLQAKQIGVRVVTSFRVTGLSASVRDGAIVGFEGGNVAVDVSLAIGEVEVASGHVDLDPHLVVPLGDGVVLIRPEPSPTVIAPRRGA
jgi:hypothetical protein